MAGTNSRKRKSCAVTAALENLSPIRAPDLASTKKRWNELSPIKTPQAKRSKKNQFTAQELKVQELIVATQMAGIPAM